jgi:PAS domain S-box-containing protein
MINRSQKLQLKFTAGFSIFFMLISFSTYIYIINTFEEDIIETHIYKAQTFLYFFEHNPEIFSGKGKTDKGTIKELVSANKALYLILENNTGKVIESVYPDNAEKALYAITTNENNISNDNRIVKVSLPVIVNNEEAGKIYVAFDASETIKNLDHKRQLTVLFCLLILLTGIIITYFFSSISFKPITKLISALDKINKGDKEIKIEYPKNNEIGILVEKINSVISELDRSSNHDKDLNAKLSKAFREKIIELDNEISQRKNAEYSFRKSEEQFGLVFKNAPIGMLMISPDNKILSVNKSFCSTTGFSSGELIGTELRLLFDDLREEKDISHTDLNSEKIMIKKNNDRINVIVKSVVIFDHRSVPKHTIVQILDITEIRKAQDEMLSALEKAEESNRLKSAFLAQMSHEIRTPLNVILASVPILGDEIGEDNTEAQMIINSVDSAGKRLHRTIDMILNLSAVQTGNYKPEFERVNIQSELAKLVSEFKSLCIEKGLELNFKCYTNTPYIFADLYTVNQIFQNLIGNSVKYTHKGNINISIEDHRDDSIIILVQDTGIGMTQEYMERLFSPFAQEDAGQKRQYEGNGLGLALVKNYIELNNAEIAVQSEKNIGSVFKVTFTKYLSNNLNEDVEEKTVLKKEFQPKHLP